VTLNVPGAVFIGEIFSFTVTFDNASPTDVGYGPYIDLIFPVIGADGAGAAVDDGIDFLGATYLGQPVTAISLTFRMMASVVWSHPYAVDNSGTPVSGLRHARRTSWWYCSCRSAPSPTPQPPATDHGQRDA
jgi:hypothetical protein